MSEVPWDDKHPEVVCHEDGASTHCFWFANADDDNIKNTEYALFSGALVLYDSLPSKFDYGGGTS